MKLTLRRGKAGGGTPLDEALRRRADGKRLGLTLAAPRDVPFGNVLRIAAVAVQAGAEVFLLEPRPAGGPGPWRLTVDGKPLALPETLGRTELRVGYVGFSNVHHLNFPELEEEEVDEEVERFEEAVRQVAERLLRSQGRDTSR